MSGAIGPLGENLVFLLGAPRSGTTLLSAMLDNHPVVTSPPEPWAMLALHQLGRVEARHPANAQVLGTAVCRFAGADGMIAAAREAGRTLYTRHLQTSGKQVFVDKTPRYWLITDFLAEVFPSARFMWLLRDPFDVAASYRTTWNLNLSDILRLSCDMPELLDLPIGLTRLEAFANAQGAAVRIVRYEQLARDPAHELAGVLEHLGLEAGAETVAAMCVLGEQGRDAGGFGDTKILATAAPHANAIGGWRDAFTPAELQVLLDAIGADQMIRLGYGDTVAALGACGIRENGAAGAGYRTRAAACLSARLSDIDYVTRYVPGGETLWKAQPRLRVALAGDGAWERMIAIQTDAAVGKLRAELQVKKDELRRQLASSEAEAQAQAAGLQAEKDALQQQLAVSEAEAQAQAAKLQAENDELRQRLAASEADALALRRSTSWRVTAPLRRLAAAFGRS